jgi:putative tryptophan/tyrosine transport system substrate-binding protein
MKRREFLGVLGFAATWPIAAQAQERATPIIGLLGRATADEVAYLVTAFRQSLAETGYVEGQNVAIEYRWADQRIDRLPALATELVSRQVSVILTSGGVAPALAAKAATSTIPIVFAVGADPVKGGLVASISRPEGNVTGVSFLATGITSKQLAILRDLVPNAAVIAVLVNPNNPEAEAITRDMQEASRALRIEALVLQVGSPRDLDSTFERLVEKRAEAILMGADQLFLSNHHQLIVLAARYRIPALFEQRESVLSGGLMSYGPSAKNAYRSAGIYVSRILRGAKPSELPILLPTKYDLVINLKTAKALGVSVPNSMQMLADEVIE